MISSNWKKGCSGSGRGLQAYLLSDSVTSSRTQVEKKPLRLPGAALN
jgi:hypothetical protein